MAWCLVLYFSYASYDQMNWFIYLFEVDSIYVVDRGKEKNMLRQRKKSCYGQSSVSNMVKQICMSIGFSEPHNFLLYSREKFY